MAKPKLRLCHWTRIVSQAAVQTHFYFFIRMKTLMLNNMIYSLRRPEQFLKKLKIFIFFLSYETRFWTKYFSIFSLVGTRAKVWKQRIESPLFCVKTYASDLEALFKLIYDRYQHGEKPDHITSLSKRATVY